VTDRQTAERRLTARYNEQCERFALTREIPLARYLAANLDCVMRGDLLQSYDRP
jgi:hypothetical protein